jgi:AraC-like DNA-binding protein
MFPSPCEFDSQYNALVFDTQYLDLPVIQNQKELADYLQQIPLQWFKKQSFYGTWTAQVIALLEEEIDIEELANKLNMTSRTLRRKLTINLFEQRNLTIADIGLKIGFNDAATFSRAFKQWTGVPPSAYRK